MKMIPHVPQQYIFSIAHRIKNHLRRTNEHIALLRVSEANEVPISSHVWVASSTFRQL